MDNVNVVSFQKQEVEDTMSCICDRFSMLGIPFDVTDEAGKACIETLGLEFEFGERIVLRNTRSRA